MHGEVILSFDKCGKHILPYTQARSHKVTKEGTVSPGGEKSDGAKRPAQPSAASAKIHEAITETGLDGVPSGPALQLEEIPVSWSQVHDPFGDLVSSTFPAPRGAGAKRCKATGLRSLPAGRE